MPHLLIHHKVRDFNSWKAVYDRHAGKRAEAGLSELHLLRTVPDSNDVVILFRAEDLSKARRFAQSEDLKKVMEDAGVIGAPLLLELE